MKITVFFKVISSIGVVACGLATLTNFFISEDMANFYISLSGFCAWATWLLYLFSDEVRQKFRTELEY